jgi:membrane fusion protein (multidrug efflux system)
LQTGFRAAVPTLAVSLLLSVLGGCKNADGEPSTPNPGAGAGAGRGAGGGRGGPGGGRGPNDRPTPVEIEMVRRGPIARTSMISGMLEPIRVVGVNAQVGGILLSAGVEEGDAVRQGQVVAEIDARELEAQLRSAEANLAFAKATLERSEKLFKQQFLTAAEYDRDRAAFEAAKATTEQLKTRVGFGKVLAPISGVVTEKRMEAGDVVSAQTRLYTVADMSTLVTLVQVSELEVAVLKVGDRVPVTIDALSGESFEGRIRRVFPTADSTTRLVPVEVALTGDTRRRLRPGYSVRATFALDRRDNALLVPSRAVSGPAGARAVFLVSGGVIARRPVRVGDDVGGSTEVLEGLVEGDSVIVSGTTQLREGAKATVVPPIGDARRAGRSLDSVGGAARRDTAPARGGRP